MAQGCGDRPQLLRGSNHNNYKVFFPLGNNVHHFYLILLPGLTLHTKTNDITADLKQHLH